MEGWDEILTECRYNRKGADVEVRNLELGAWNLILDVETREWRLEKLVTLVRKEN